MMNTTPNTNPTILPYVTQALARWYRGTDRREAQTAVWYRAMATRLHAASLQWPERREQLERCAGLARQCAALAA